MGLPGIVDPAVVPPNRDQLLSQLRELQHTCLILQLDQLQCVCSLNALKVAGSLNLQQKVKDSSIFWGIDESADFLRLRYGMIWICYTHQIVGQFVGKVCACKYVE